MSDHFCGLPIPSRNVHPLHSYSYRTFLEHPISDMNRAFAHMCNLVPLSTTFEDIEVLHQVSPKVFIRERDGRVVDFDFN